MASAADVLVRVTDPHNSAIPSATVSLISRNGERRTLTADSSGTCYFTDVAAGQYFIQEEAPDFDLSAPRSIDLKKVGLIEVALPLGRAKVRSTVTVTASGTPQSTDEVSKALTIVEAIRYGSGAKSRTRKNGVASFKTGGVEDELC